MSTLTRITPTDVTRARAVIARIPNTADFKGAHGPNAWHEAGTVAAALDLAPEFPDFTGGLVTDPEDPEGHWIALGTDPDLVDFWDDEVTNHGLDVTADPDAVGEDAALAWALGMIDESRNPEHIENDPSRDED